MNMNNEESTAMSSDQKKSVLASALRYGIRGKEDLLQCIDVVLSAVQDSYVTPQDTAAALMKALDRHLDKCIQDPNSFRSAARVLRAHAAAILAERC